MVGGEDCIRGDGETQMCWVDVVGGGGFIMVESDKGCKLYIAG